MNNEYLLKSLPEYKQNISKAKALLSKAGVSPSDLTGTCYTASGYPDLEAGGTILQSSIAALGGSIQVQAVPYGTIETDVTKVATSPALTSSLYNGTFTLDPTSFISEFLPGTFSSEFMRWDSGDLLKAYNQASEGTTQAEIVAGLNSAQKIIAADAPVIFGAQPQLLIPVPDYLEGYVMQQTFDEYPCLFFQLRLRAR
jgi:ABC-type transport system substrate-binding protein